MGKYSKDSETAPLLVAFIRFCFKQGTSLEQVRDALLVANLERALIEEAIETVLFKKSRNPEPSEEILLDIQKTETESESIRPDRMPQVRKIGERTKIELCTIPRFKKKQKLPFRKPVEKSVSLKRILRSGFAVAIALNLLALSTGTKFTSSPVSRVLASGASAETVSEPAPSEPVRKPLRLKIASTRIRHHR